MHQPGNPVPDTLFVFIDESGNFDFSPRGTQHFVMAGIVALAPLATAAALQALRYQLLAQGEDVRQFHASEDRQHVRDAVFALIPHLPHTKAHVVYGDKTRAPTSMRSDAALHADFGAALIEFAVEAHSASQFRQTVVIFDQALTRAKQGAFHSVVKPRLRALGKPFHLYFQPMIADTNGQLADYVAWSKFVALERGENRPWSTLERSLDISERDLLAADTPFGPPTCDRPD